MLSRWRKLSLPDDWEQLWAESLLDGWEVRIKKIRQSVVRERTSAANRRVIPGNDA